MGRVLDLTILFARGEQNEFAGEVHRRVVGFAFGKDQMGPGLVFDVEPEEIGVGRVKESQIIVLFYVSTKIEDVTIGLGDVGEGSFNIDGVFLRRGLTSVFLFGVRR